MRVLLINTSERIGGAAIAASRLMESLKNHGIKAKLLVRDKQTDQISVVLPPHLHHETLRSGVSAEAPSPRHREHCLQG